MKKQIIKILSLFIILLVLNIPESGAYFTSSVQVRGNTMSTSCWANPNAPALSLPADASYTNNPNVTFEWDRATSSCPIADLTYKFEAFDNPGLTGTPVYYSDWITGTSFSVDSIPDGTYYWHVVVKDQYGNQSTSTAWSVTVDTIKPVSIITKPINPGSDNTVYTLFWRGDIEGTADDSGSGIDHVDLSIHRLVLDLFWNGTAWLPGTESSVRVLATGTNTWSYTLPPPHVGIFLITSHAVDKAGNVEDSYTITVVNDEPDESVLTPDISVTPEATPTATPESSASPTPSPSPSISASPTSNSSETSQPSVAPESTVAPSDAPTETPNPTPTPTATPEEIVTPTPTPSETPTPTPEESATPTPESSPSPEASTTPTATEVPSPTDTPQ